MMARGSGSAIGGSVVLALAALLMVGLFVATSAPVAEAAAASYMVGDYGGWKFNVDRWAKGRTFRAGDVLGTYTCISTGCSSVHIASARVCLPLRVAYVPAACVVRARACSVQLQPCGARRGGRERGGVPELRGAQGRQGAAERARQGEARQRHALLRLHRAGTLSGRNEDRRQGRVVGDGDRWAGPLAMCPTIFESPDRSAA